MTDKTCYDCAWSTIETACTPHRALTCGKGDKILCVPFGTPAPKICEDYCRKSGVPILEAISEKEREALMQMYKESQMYNPEISMEDFFFKMDSGIFGIYPKE